MRYSALIGGALYGIMHRRTLQAKEDLRKESHHADRREQLIQQAREAWKNKQQAGKSDGKFVVPVSAFLGVPLLIQDYCCSHYQPRRSQLRFRETLRKMGKGILIDLLYLTVLVVNMISFILCHPRCDYCTNHDRQ